ncbi:MAG: hypothetical protein Q9180_001598 [Flavoplaca navasiana]
MYILQSQPSKNLNRGSFTSIQPKQSHLKADSILDEHNLLPKFMDQIGNFLPLSLDTTTQMIETIWPLSVLSCGRDTSTEGKNQNLIGLRTFVQEVLRRSKTSYSTLQVALYYLILIQSCLPRHDFTMEQREDSQACRAMQCGRRMFLASLILASKYLQDRNFSARAWSKISGLKACEINANEMAFLTAVNWKLHIPEPVFHRWTDIVLKYSPSASPLASPRSSPRAINSWRAVIPRLTPALDRVNFGHAELTSDTHGTISKARHSFARHLEEPVWSESNEPTPTNTNGTPRTLEPTPRATCTGSTVLPALPRPGPLPTPKLTTPQPSNFTPTFSTPAVGAEGLGPRRSSMSIAIEQARNASAARMTLDTPNPSWRSVVSQTYPTPARKSSLARSSSSLSSPESMISDVSSRSSRSSSISSIASTCALPLSKPGGLAAQATRRCANMQLSDIRESAASVHSEPAILQSPAENANNLGPWLADTGISASPGMPTEHGGNYTFKPLPSDSISCTASVDHEAALVLSTLGLNHKPLGGAPISRPTESRKRSRPLSMDLGVQDSVRDLTIPRYLSELPNGIRRNEDDSTVLPDGKVADSFLMPKAGECQVKEGLKENQVKSMLAKEGPRKRTCGNASRHETARLGRIVHERSLQPRPGMWEGII